MPQGYVDSDGHIFESEAELNDYLEPPYNGRYNSMYSMLPTLDGFHTAGAFLADDTEDEQSVGFNTNVGPKEWVDFLDRSGIECAALYPTWGLAYGVIVDPDWSAAYAHAYNKWLSDKYMAHSPRLKGLALVPLQDIPTAIEELRLAVGEYGMLGAMVSSNPNGVARHIGAKEFWPLYEEAEKLGCVIAFHGGGYTDLGMNTFTSFPAVRALGHPWPLAVGATALICHGVFDAFPNLHVGMMEGGASWVPLVVDRLEREAQYGDLNLPRPVADYFKQIYLSVEAFDKALVDTINRIGTDSIMYSTDFPHEVSPDDIIKELGHMTSRGDLDDGQKHAILEGNARRFYRI
jgi:predicted TIM-barrel fold metal-dependent hydrolase